MRRSNFAAGFWQFSLRHSQCRVISLPNYIILGLPHFDTEFPRPLCLPANSNKKPAWGAIFHFGIFLFISAVFWS